MAKLANIADFRTQVDGLIAAGSLAQAYRMLTGRTLAMPPFYEYPYLAEGLGKCQPQVVACRMGILSTFTLEGIRDVLKAVALANGFGLETYFGGYGQLEQEILDPAGGLRAHQPKLIVLAWRLEDISAPLGEWFLELSSRQVAEEVEAALGRIRALAAGCRANFPDAAVLLQSFVPPAYPALGILDVEHASGQQKAVATLNAGLVELAGAQSGVHVLDCAALARRSGEAWQDSRHWHVSRAPLGPAALVDLAWELVKYVRAVTGRTKKALVLDLDNTLWGGVLGEEGPMGISLGAVYPGSCFAAFQKEVRGLSQRGIVLAINSKNNEADVREAFEKNPQMVLKWDDFAAVRINWDDKVSNMRLLAEDLSLGLDSFVFVDDNPYELEMVQQALPEVTAVQVPAEPASLPGLLSKLGYFDSLVFSEEDRQRGHFYRGEAQRTRLRQDAGDLESFYRSLQMKLGACPVSKMQVARVAQLTQRTNQFNVTTRRYSESDIQRLSGDPRWVARAYSLTDRFGDSGVISVALARKEKSAWVLDTFLMSCRVIGRTVETAILALIAAEARAAGAKELVGQFIPTKKNAPAKDLFERHGFRQVRQADGGSIWSLDLQAGSLKVPPWFTVEQAGG